MSKTRIKNEESMDLFLIGTGFSFIFQTELICNKLYELTDLFTFFIESSHVKEKCYHIWAKPNEPISVNELREKMLILEKVVIGMGVMLVSTENQKEYLPWVRSVLNFKKRSE